MYRVLFFLLVVGASRASASFIDSPIFINEFHYDNVGADVGEFVEVVAPASFRDLAKVTLTLYNGGNGAAYAGPTGLHAFTRGAEVDGFVMYTLDLPLQNGSPDGLALAFQDQVLQFLSYEGTFTATNGVAAGLVSTDVGVFEPPDTPVGTSLQLAGSGDSYCDFAWRPSAAHTWGAVNHDQSFVVPEPHSAFIWLAAAATAAAAVARRRRSNRLKATRTRCAGGQTARSAP